MSTESEPADDDARWEIQTDTTAIFTEPTTIVDKSSYGSSTSDGVQAANIGTRTASISRDAKGNPLSIVLVVNPDELHDAGLEIQEADKLEYGFVNGSLLVTIHD